MTLAKLPNYKLFERGWRFGRELLFGLALCNALVCWSTSSFAAYADAHCEIAGEPPSVLHEAAPVSFGITYFQRGPGSNYQLDGAPEAILDDDGSTDDAFDILAALTSSASPATPGRDRVSSLRPAQHQHGNPVGCAKPPLRPPMA